MAERTLRGSRLGSVSYETDRNTELAPRQDAVYRCSHGHEFSVPFSGEADTPPTWECKFDGTVAHLIGATEPESKSGKPGRTHWDMLMERRTIADLEEVLEERLETLRQRRSPKKSA